MLIHVLFNVIGTVLFTVLCICTPLVTFMQGTNPGNPAGQIANLHTVFNIVTTVLLIPFGTLLAAVVEKILPERGETDTGMKLLYIRKQGLQGDKLGVSAISMDTTKKEIMRMLEMTKENVHLCYDAFMNRRADLVPQVDEKEEYIDFLNKEISKHISKMITHERTVNGSRIYNSYFKITSNIERIGDHALNISKEIAQIQLLNQ